MREAVPAGPTARPPGSADLLLGVQSPGASSCA